MLLLLGLYLLSSLSENMCNTPKTARIKWSWKLGSHHSPTSSFPRNTAPWRAYIDKIQYKPWHSLLNAPRQTAYISQTRYGLVPAFVAVSRIDFLFLSISCALLVLFSIDIHDVLAKKKKIKVELISRMYCSDSHVQQRKTYIGPKQCI